MLLFFWLPREGNMIAHKLGCKVRISPFSYDCNPYLFAPLFLELNKVYFGEKNIYPTANSYHQHIHQVLV